MHGNRRHLACLLALEFQGSLAATMTDFLAVAAAALPPGGARASRVAWEPALDSDGDAPVDGVSWASLATHTCE